MFSIVVSLLAGALVGDIRSGLPRPFAVPFGQSLPKELSEREKRQGLRLKPQALRFVGVMPFSACAIQSPP